MLAEGFTKVDPEKLFKEVSMKRFVWLLALAILLVPVFAFAQKVTLEFVVWNYSLETIQDNIAQFEQANPNIKVNVKDYTWPTYHDTMVLRFKGKTKTDVFYNGEDWLPEFAAAGWVAPLEDYFPEVRKYKEKTAPYALADMTYNGKLYGLSYYADLITFQYNKKILKDKGITVAQHLGRRAERQPEAEGRRHGVPLRLRVRRDAAQLPAGLHQPGVRPRRGHVRRQAQAAVQ